MTMKRAFGIVAVSLAVVAGSVGIAAGIASGAAAATAPRTVLVGPWSIVPSPNPRPTNGLNGVSCLSTSFCFAVGEAAGGGVGGATLVERWNGNAWTLVPSPNIATPGVASYLSSVSCVTASFCMAAGISESATAPDRTLFERWNGSAWSIVPSPNVATANDDLSGISCTSATFCVAVGSSRVPLNAFRSLALQWNGSTWTIVVSADTSSNLDNILGGVSCKSPSWCMAAGDAYDASDAEQPMTQRWNGVSFSMVPTASPSVTKDAALDGISCVSQSDCFAVGFEEPSGPVNATLTERWNGSSWTIVPSPTTVGTLSEELESVSCVGPSLCAAVGSNETGRTPYRSVSVAETWNGTSWALQAPPSPPGVVQTALYGVSCVSGHACTAAGQSLPNGSIGQTVIESASIVRPGYRFVASDGGVFNFGEASFNGSHGGQAL